MAWGMYLPPAGGPYGPYGYDEGLVDAYDEGWRHRLIKYYTDEMPKAQKTYYRNQSNYATCVVNKFTHEIGRESPWSDGVAITPIEEHEPLRFYQLQQRYNEISSILSLSSKMWAVDETVKRMIERLEPGLHQFFPLEIRMPRGRIYSTAYYVLVVGRWLDGFLPDYSDQDAFLRYESKPYHTYGRKKDICGLAFQGAVIKGSHLWRERVFGASLACLSDILVGELTAAGLKLPKHYKMRVV